ncbi:hypothetical protein AABB24_012257, partial [Solanum stoloniferum]
PVLNLSNCISLSLSNFFSLSLSKKMGYSMRLFATFFLVAMLLLSTEMGPMSGGAEARTCESQSHSFKGPCVGDTNCASVCQTEGFIGGDCRGLRRQCFCTRNC